MRRSVAVGTAVASSGAVAATSGVSCRCGLHGGCIGFGWLGWLGRLLRLFRDLRDLGRISGISGISGVSGISGNSGMSGIWSLRVSRSLRDVWYPRYLRDNWLTDNWLGDDGSRLSGHIDRRHCRGGRFTQFFGRSGGDRQCTRLRRGFRRRLRRGLYRGLWCCLRRGLCCCSGGCCDALRRPSGGTFSTVARHCSRWRRCSFRRLATLPLRRWRWVAITPLALMSLSAHPSPTCPRKTSLRRPGTPLMLTPRPFTCRNACASIMRRLSGLSRLDSPRLLCHSETEQRVESRSSNNTVWMMLCDALCLL